jgi:hypothetical protein
MANPRAARITMNNRMMKTVLRLLAAIALYMDGSTHLNETEVSIRGILRIALLNLEITVLSI